MVSLSNFSNTAVFASNKILPSIVGIEVSYTVTSNSIGSFFGYSQPQNSTATATGSGIIISEDGYIVTNNHVVDSTSSNSYYELSKATSIKIKLNREIAKALKTKVSRLNITPEEYVKSLIISSI